MEAANSLSDEDLSLLLARTSRTFALAIPQLPGELRQQIGIAYLLFRIIDTVEDGDLIDRTAKLKLLGQFTAVLSAEESLADFDGKIKEFADATPSSDVDELSLHRRSASVIARAQTFPSDRQNIIFSAVRRSAHGMGRFVGAGDPGGHVRIESMPELHEYCFAVAGIVGEMLTQLFVAHDQGLLHRSEQLMFHSVAFGEALQLVNILRDSTDDLLTGSSFIPADISRAELTALAGRNLDRADYYIRIMRESCAADGVIRFIELPMRLARRTLSQVERLGPGAKVSRCEVMQILTDVAGGRSPEVFAAGTATGGRP